MTGGMDDSGRSRHIQDFPVGDLVELSDRRHSGYPIGQ
jgi:hypothetical protein